MDSITQTRALPVCKNCGKAYDPNLDSEKIAKVRAVTNGGFQFCSGHCGAMPWLDAGYEQPQSPAPAPHSLAAADIVKTDDLHALEVARRLLTMDDDSLIEMRGIVQKVRAKRRERFAAEDAEDKLVDEISGAILLRKIIDSRGRAIAHDRYVVEIMAAKSIEKRIDVLRRLEGKVPDDELRKALYLTNPQPEWKADARALGTLLRKYGPDSEIGQIIREGLVETYGQPQLVFREREQIANVTPMERAS
jgi:hypothetical protein